MVNIGDELNRILKAFYTYDFPEDESKAIDNLFKIIERTWLGIFNNALIRTNPEITTLQEFAAYNDNGLYGRCDLLFRYADREKLFDFL